MLSNVIDKHLLKIIIVLIVISIIAPFAVGVICSRLNSNGISADGILSYVGNIIVGVITLLVAFIAIYQSKRAWNLESEQQIERRKELIRPNLQIFFEKNEDDSYTIKIYNQSDNIATHICAFVSNISPFVKKEHHVERKIRFDDNACKEALLVDDFGCEFDEAGYPKEINLIYNDKDNNVLSQTFKCYYEDGLHIYQSDQIEYC